MPASTDTPVAAATDTPAPAMPIGPGVVNVSQNATLGSFLVDSAEMTLYVYAMDTPGASTCTGACSANWPPLLTNGAPVSGMGATASMLGTTTRSDGTVQVTYNGWPLYHFIKDKAVGDTNGQGVKSVWSVISPAGMPVASAAATVAPTAAAAGGAVVNLGQNSSLGSFLVASNGMTLYMFTQDTANTSTCYDTCASYWYPLLTTGAPVAGQGVTASLLGTTTRTDGSMQVTYNGHPLYTYSSDSAAGDTSGEGSQSSWYVITPDGMQK